MKASSLSRLVLEWKGWARWSREPGGSSTSSSTYGGQMGCHCGAAGGAGELVEPLVLTPISLKVCRELRARLLMGSSGGRESLEGLPQTHSLVWDGGGDPKVGGRPRAPPAHQSPPWPGTGAAPPHRLPLRGEMGVKAQHPQPGAAKGAVALPWFPQGPAGFGGAGGAVFPRRGSHQAGASGFAPGKPRLWHKCPARG